MMTHGSSVAAPETSGLAGEPPAPSLPPTYRLCSICREPIDYESWFFIHEIWEGGKMLKRWEVHPECPPLVVRQSVKLGSGR